MLGDMIVRMRCIAMLFIASLVALPAGAAENGTKVVARVLDTQGGLPVPNITVELDSNGKQVATARTDAGGAATFVSVAPGTYAVLMHGTGYQTTRLQPDLIVSNDVPEVAFQVAVSRARQGLKTIGYVATAGRQSLQTSATINAYVDTALLQSENFQRLGDVLTTVPGVTTQTSSSVGDDMSLSIRGFSSTETATLLDGHPIGPTGALGGGYNYNVSPFWGLSGTSVIFGSGATGLYGTHTIAGAVNFETINPTRENHFSITQGVGSNDKLMSGFLGTGTVGKLGYAMAWGVQGTNGNFPGGIITQRAFLQNSVIHAPLSASQCTKYYGAGASCSSPPDLTSANVNNYLNSYWVTGQFSQYNFTGKMQWNFSSRTQLTATAYSANDWSNSTGEGDNDYFTWPYALYKAYGLLSSFPKGIDTILVGGKPKSCVKSIAVLEDVSGGYSCLSATQYATAFYGPNGGGIDRWRSLGNQDYDLRLTQGTGAGTLTVDGFTDAYNYNLQKGPGTALGKYTTYGPGPFYLDLYKTRGFAVGEDFSIESDNDLGFGYTWLQEAQNGGFSTANSAGTGIGYFSYNPELYLSTASYYVRDSWMPTTKFSAYGNFWVQHSVDTNATYFDPRVSFVYHPTNADVVRFSAGKSYSEPDPSLLAVNQAPVYGAPSSINCPAATSGTGSLTTIASVPNPDVKPERAQDLELALGHRFNNTTNLQADVYQAWESQALYSGLVPITTIPQINVPQALIDQYISRLAKCPGLNPSINSLAFSTTYNATSARYRGIVLNGQVGVARNVQLNLAYNIQSAAYLGIPTDILQSNTNLIDGGQVAGVPLRQANAGLSYQNQTGFGARIDETYVGENNSWNRPAFWFADGSISQSSADGKTTVTLGVNNLFNNGAQQYGLVGQGVYVPQNYYGLQSNGGPASAIEQGTEEYGIPYRQYWLAVKFGI